MNKDNLAKVASHIVASNRGILAADESTPTMGKRLAMIDQENTEDNRRDFRQALFDTQGIEDYISGVILFEETLMHTLHNTCSTCYQCSMHKCCAKWVSTRAFTAL